MQELVDHNNGPEESSRRSLAEKPAGLDEAKFRLFDDEGNMVPNATEVMAAWEAKCAADLERANASYQAAQRKFLGNSEALSAIPSRLDRLRSRAPPGTNAAGKTMAETLAEAEGIIDYSKKQTAASNTMLEDLMKPEQRGPYR